MNQPVESVSFTCSLLLPVKDYLIKLSRKAHFLIRPLTKKAENIYTNTFLKNFVISSLNKEKLFEYTVEELAKLMAKTNEEVSKDHPGYTIPAAVEDDLIPYDVLEGSKKKINKDVKLLI